MTPIGLSCILFRIFALPAWLGVRQGGFSSPSAARQWRPSQRGQLAELGHGLEPDSATMTNPAIPAPSPALHDSRAASRKPASLAVALYCGIGSSSLKALVKAFDRLHMVRGWKSSNCGWK